MHPEMPRAFKVPAVPAIPLISMALCVFLVIQLDTMTWIAFVLWTIAGLAIYFAYGMKHSKASETLEKKQDH